MAEKKKDGVAKLFIRASSYYIFSNKRKRSSHKNDHRLELIGGQIESGESPLEALIREVGEEELSRIIAAKTKKQFPKCKRVVVDKEDHFIFEISVNDDDFKNMRHNDRESYGFVKVEVNIIDEKDKLRTNLSRFTPKTGKIFHALELV